MYMFLRFLYHLCITKHIDHIIPEGLCYCQHQLQGLYTVQKPPLSFHPCELETTSPYTTISSKILHAMLTSMFAAVSWGHSILTIDSYGFSPEQDLACYVYKSTYVRITSACGMDSRHFFLSSHEPMACTSPCVLRMTLHGQLCGLESSSA